MVPQSDTAVAEAILAWENHVGVEVIRPQQPLLAHGQSGASLLDVIVRRPHADSQRILIKVCAEDSATFEAARHALALRANRDFAERHLIEMPYGPWPIGDGRSLMFQERLAGCVHLDELEAEDLVSACRYVARAVIGWTTARRHTVETVPAYLERELNRQSRGTLIGDVSDRFDLPDADWVTIDGEVLPNPLRLCGDRSMLADIKIDVECGRAHSDLQMRNILVPCDHEQRPQWERMKLVDLPGFSEDAPLTRDIATLLMSALRPTVADLPDGQSRALTRLVIGPAATAPASLPADVARLVTGIYDGSPKDLRETPEWRRQYLLSIVADALRHASYDNAGHRGRWWYLGLAARAAALFSLDVTGPPPPRDAPVVTPPPYRDPGPAPQERSAGPTTGPAAQGGTARRPGARDAPTPVPPPREPTETAPGAGGRPPSTARRLLVASGVVAAVVSAVALTYLVVLPRQHRSAVPAGGPTLWSELEAVADRVGADNEPHRLGEYIHTEVLSDVRETTPGGRRQQFREHVWRRPDGYGCRLYLPADAGREPTPVQQPFTPSDSSGLDEEPSDDPEVLRGQLQRVHGPDLGAAGVLRAAAELYRLHDLRPKQRAALLRVLGTTRNVARLGVRHDSLDRAGLAIDANLVHDGRTANREILIIDRTTGRLLEWQMVTVGPSGGQSVDVRVTFVASERVDLAGCQIPAPD
jgi:hypothetical protein